MINNIKESYVTLEIAKLLKEKGFNTIDQKAKSASTDTRDNDTIIFTFYMEDSEGQIKFITSGTNSTNINGLFADYNGTLHKDNLYKWYLAPTIAVTVKWVRENFGIHIQFLVHANKTYAPFIVEEKEQPISQIPLNIKDFVMDNNKVYFKCYKQGFFMYTLWDKERKNTYEFIIPLDDIGTATMLDEDKAITFMRWIRKAIQENTLIKL